MSKVWEIFEIYLYMICLSFNIFNFCIFRISKGKTNTFFDKFN